MFGKRSGSQGLRARRKALLSASSGSQGAANRKGDRPARAPTSLRFKVIATLSVLSVLGGVAEGVSRYMGPQIPKLKGDNNNQVIMVSHPTRLWGMAPGVKNNAGVFSTINEKGLRGQLPEAAREDGQERILILGDSTFFGHGVEDDETLGAALERILQEEGHSVMVINGAIPGYSTEQVRLLLEEDGWDLDPTLLIVGCLWSDNNWDVFRDRDLLRTQNKFQNNPLSRSHFYRLLSGWIDRVRGGDGARIITWTRESEWPTVGQRRVSLQRYAENLDAIARQAAQRDIGVMFIRPVNVEVVSEKHFTGGFSWDPYIESQRRVAAFHDIPVVSAFPPFRDAYERFKNAPETADKPMKELFLDRMHPTAFGLSLLASTVAERLESLSWPDNHLIGRTDGDFGLGGLPPDTWEQPRSEVGKQLSPFQGMFEEGGRMAR